MVTEGKVSGRTRREGHRAVGGMEGLSSSGWTLPLGSLETWH